MSSGLWWALLAVLFGLGAITGRGLLVILSVILALASGASELWARYCLANLTLTRRLGRHQLEFGQETTLILEVVNAKPLPLPWLLVQDRFPYGVELLTGKLKHGAPGYAGSLVALLSLRWYERVVRTHRIRGSQRGIYRFGPASLTSGDIFGARQRQEEAPGTETLVVYPRLVPVQARALPSDRPVGAWLARRRIVEDPLRFAGVRPYVPGDNPRYIHWKASSRLGQMQTKVYDPSANLAMVLALDVQTMPRTFEGVPAYLEYMATAAGSLAMQALDERHTVGLAHNGLSSKGGRWVYVRPGRRPEQALAILTALAGVDVFRGMAFAELLATLMPLLPLGATLLAMSALPSEAIYEALLALQESGHAVTLFTVGDEPPDVPPAIPSQHLGGTDAWEHLETLDLA